MNATVQPSHSFRLTGLRFLACLVLAFGLITPTAQAWLGHGLYFTGSSGFPNSWGSWQDLTPWNTHDGLAGTGLTNDSTFSSAGRTFTRQTFQIRNDSTDVISFDLAVFAGEAWSGGGSVTIQPGATTWVPADVYSDDGTVTEQQVAYNLRRTAAATPKYTLTTATTGQGTGTISPGTSTYNAGTSVTVTATATNGSEFRYFLVSVGGVVTQVDTPSFAVTMDASKTVTALFNPPGTDNHPPTVTISGPTAPVEPGKTFTLTATASDQDVNLTSITITKPSGTITAANGVSPDSATISGSDTAGAAGTSVTYTAMATDAAGEKATAMLTVTFGGTTPPNSSPSVTLSGPTDPVQPGASFTLNANATDADGNLSSITITKSGGTIASTGASGSSGSLSGSDTAGAAGSTVTYTATATDAAGLSGTSSFTVTVAGGTAPEVTASITFTALAAQAPGLGVLSWSSANATSVVVSAPALGGTISTEPSGSATYGNLAAGTYTATITAKGDWGTVTKDASITVSPATISRHMASNYTPRPVPWQGGLVTIFGDCTVAGTFDVVIYRRTMNGSAEVSRAPVYSTTVDIPVVSGGTFLTWTVSQATERGYAGNRYFVAVFTPRDTRISHSCEIMQNGIPAAQTQTVTISPAMPVGAPGQDVTLTASGGHFGYVWTNESSNGGQPAAGTLTPNGDTATFTVPATATMGDTFVVSAYATAGGPLGSDWAQSEKTYVTITCGTIVENGSFRIGIVARPAVLPYTGGEVEITTSIQALTNLSGIGKSLTVTGPSTTYLAAPSHSIAPSAPAITKRTAVIAPNLSSSIQNYSAVLSVWASGVNTLTASAPISVQAVPANTPPYLSMTAVPDILWDGNFIYFSVGGRNAFGSWNYTLYSPSTSATVSAGVTMPDGSAFSPAISAAFTPEYPDGNSPQAARTWTVAPNKRSGGSGDLSNAPKTPLGEYTVRMTATNAAGTTVKEAKGRVKARGDIYAWWDAPTLEYSTDPDTGEQSPLTPYDFGWSVSGNGAILGIGDSAPLTVVPGTRYRFVRWRDGAGNTLSESLSITVTATQRYTYVYAVLEDANAPKLTPTITWPTPAAITYGTALSGTQLNATASYGGNAVSGTMTYSPAAGAVLEPGTQTLTATFTPTNTARYNPTTATVQLSVVFKRTVTEFTPVASSYTVNDSSSPMNGQTYNRIWREGSGWAAYLGRNGVRFSVKGQAHPSVQTVEIQAKPPGRAWALLATQSPAAGLSSVDLLFSVMLDTCAAENPLMPESYKAGAPLTGQWLFRARVQDSGGTWSDFSPEVVVDVVLPISTKTVTGQTIPPAGEVGKWFTASPVQSFAIPLWIP